MEFVSLMKVKHFLSLWKEGGDRRYNAAQKETVHVRCKYKEYIYTTSRYSYTRRPQTRLYCKNILHISLLIRDYFQLKDFARSCNVTLNLLQEFAMPSYILPYASDNRFKLSYKRPIWGHFKTHIKFWHLPDFLYLGNGACLYILTLHKQVIF